jgi:hypothetical protein
MSYPALINNVQVPSDLALYDGSGDPGILLDWQARAATNLCEYSQTQFDVLSDLGPVDVCLEATSPTPDTIFLEWCSRSYHSMPFLAPMPFETAPAINHTLDLLVKASLWTRSTFVDAGGGSGGDVCSVAPSACNPEADLNLVAAPVGNLTMVVAPDAVLTQTVAPIASLECKMP